MNNIQDVIIIGSGPAGYTAAIYCARSGLKCQIIKGNLPGGQLTTTTHVENYPGYESIKGPELMKKMHDQCLKQNCSFANDFICEIKKQDAFFICYGYENKYVCKSIIICTGSTPKFLGIEKDFLGRGVSTCATCDGEFFRNMPVAVIGGGNTACEEAIYLKRLCSKVYLIHRRNEFRADYSMSQKVKNSSIEILTPYVLKKINDVKGEINSIDIENVNSKNIKQLHVKGIFIAIGTSPNSSNFKNILTVDENGYILSKDTMTNIKGIFVAGDVTDKKYRQAITSAGEGCKAAINAREYIENL